jgi:hypothetical protein
MIVAPAYPCNQIDTHQFLLPDMLSHDLAWLTLGHAMAAFVRERQPAARPRAPLMPKEFALPGWRIDRGFDVTGGHGETPLSKFVDTRRLNRTPASA